MSLNNGLSFKIHNYDIPLLQLLLFLKITVNLEECVTGMSFLVIEKEPFTECIIVTGMEINAISLKTGTIASVYFKETQYR